MANYLINSPSSQTVGTNTSDLFDLEVIDGVSVFGTEGADTIAVSAGLAGSAARINAGKGADTLTFTGGSLENSEIFLGMGKDFFTSDSNLSSTVVRGGAGLDTLQFNDIFISAATINGNDMADTISAGIDGGSTAGFVAAGLGKDTLSAVFDSGAGSFTINGGAGHDSIEIASTNAADLNGLSALEVAGGAGLDSIGMNVNAAAGLTGAYAINGGDLGDLITIDGGVSSIGTATIGGGAGADTIRFSATATLDNGFINAGLGNDSVYISAGFDGGTLNGGAGKDSITLGLYATGAVNDGEIFGGDAADVISLGSANVVGNTGGVVSGGGDQLDGGSTVSYANLGQSDLEAFDNVSAGLDFTFAGISATGVKNTATLFTISQDVLTASAANGIANTNFTGTNGKVTFTSTFSTNLTARVTELDTRLNIGQVAAFSDNSGNHYVFLQSGAAAAGTDGDLLVQVNTAADALSVAGNSAISYTITETQSAGST